MQQDTQPVQSYLSTIQAAIILNISPRTLERWRLTGDGPSYRKFGKRVTYSQTTLLEWAEEQTHTSTSDVA